MNFTLKCSVQTKNFDIDKYKTYKFRIGVVVCSITATVYYGGLCTQKYISDPVTVTTDIVPLDNFQPLKWSICKQATLTDCTTPLENVYGSIFTPNDNDHDYYYEEDNTTTTSTAPSVGK